MKIVVDAFICFEKKNKYLVVLCLGEIIGALVAIVYSLYRMFNQWEVYSIPTQIEAEESDVEWYNYNYQRKTKGIVEIMEDDIQRQQDDLLDFKTM